MIFFTRTHFTGDETEARRIARWPSSQRYRKLGQLLQSWQIRSLKPTLPLQTTRKAGQIWGVLLNNNKELTKQERTRKPISRRRKPRDKPDIWGCPPKATCQFWKTAGRASVNLREEGGQI